MSAGVAALGGWLATELLDVTEDLTALDGAGWWAVALPYRGRPVLARFARVHRAAPAPAARSWPGIDPGSWRTSLDRPEFGSGVRAIRSAIARGEVYQVNLTRRLSAPLPRGADPFMLAGSLAALLAARHPAPHAGHLLLPAHGVAVVSASPERFLRRDARTVLSQPIKGTASDEGPAVFGDKDRAENVMIVDLVRNDLGRVCEPGSVTVPALFARHRQPGLVHLVSSVRGRLAAGVGWAELLAATFPPGSITGAPKLAACDLIDRLEPVPRGPYCGALGWVDADRGVGDLNVAIRTFWFEPGELCFGTGAGITWCSDPAGEWEETVLKSRRLIAAVSRPE